MSHSTGGSTSLQAELEEAKRATVLALLSSHQHLNIIEIIGPNSAPVECCECLHLRSDKSGCHGKPIPRVLAGHYWFGQFKRLAVANHLHQIKVEQGHMIAPMRCPRIQTVSPLAAHYGKASAVSKNACPLLYTAKLAPHEHALNISWELSGTACSHADVARAKNRTSGASNLLLAGGTEDQWRELDKKVGHFYASRHHQSLLESASSGMCLVFP